VILRVVTSRSVLLGAAAVAMLIGVCVVRFTVADQGVMLFAVVPIALLGMMYGVRGGLAGAVVSSAVFLVWLFTRGQPSVLKAIEEPVVFFVLGLVTGIYAGGALGDCDPRHAIQRAGLRRAIRSGEVVFHYQPLADVATRRVVGLEALARWEHPVRGRIEPAEFIPLAEGDERTIWELTLLALDRALADLGTWGEAAGDLTIWINVSSVSLERRDLAAEFSPTLDEHAVPASRLAIEITETALVAKPRRAAQALDSLKELGATIVVDDFGTGRSSISRLGRLPIDALKVELNRIGPPLAVDAHRILKAIIEMARALELRVVAEHVDDEVTWGEAARLGCDLVQGFGLSPPLPADQVQAWLEHMSLTPVARLP
jgi:EAL domain-containing protein (putative c-di-GMP-specific phosphodiesterase class I)